MANGDFTLTVTLNGTTTSGRSENISVSKTFTGVAQSVNQELTITDTSTEIFKTSGTSGAGQLVSPVQAIVITNKDADDILTIGLIDGTSKACYFNVGVGEVFVLCDSLLDENITGGAVGNLTNITSITAKFPTSQTGTVEMLVIK